jgi:Txe/YoeB family toxin of Txe-Axe toxin-antitoxin module
MRRVVFSPSALNNLKLFKSGNQKLVFKILEMLTDMQTDPFKGDRETGTFERKFQRVLVSQNQ